MVRRLLAVTLPCFLLCRDFLRGFVPASLGDIWSQNDDSGVWRRKENLALEKETLAW